MSGAIEPPERLIGQIEAIANRLIRQATERGEFDDLPGTGKPIANLRASRDPDWWAKAWLAREKVPPRLRRFAVAVGEMLIELGKSTDEIDVRNDLSGLNEMISKVQKAYPEFTLQPFDGPDTILAWRRGEIDTSYQVGVTS